MDRVIILELFYAPIESEIEDVKKESDKHASIK